ncbi:unnamed protein product [Notodromas monacha]|uniref:Protein N-terminal glutamine amidohydrolase n=1 Tax=Notodromas monacha TaxID=399045 RepID=A0A7R9GD35_9CRUS|nr:unnamed protein product [Notodromas monacha]CAG0916503.1 unnamed protein product [Notodromas monacha]
MAACESNPTSFISAQRGKGVPELLPLASECVATPYYCEENVWKLCEYVECHRRETLPNCFAVFISNDKRAVPLWRQKAGRSEDKLVIWRVSPNREGSRTIVPVFREVMKKSPEDYHAVVMYSEPGSKAVVYDLDSELPFPTFFHKYVTETFRTDEVLKPEYHRYFRVVPAEQFLRIFASDRSHMLKEDGSWLKPPPNYPPIVSQVSQNNLENFISMNPNVDLGHVYTLKQLVAQFHVT